MPSNQKSIRRGTSRKGLVVALIVTFVLLSGTAYYFFSFRGELFSTVLRQPTQVAQVMVNKATDSALGGIVVATLFLPIDEEIRPNEIKIATNAVQTAMIDTLVSEFCRLLPEHLKDIKLNSSYKDRDGVVYLDFNSELKAKASLSAAQEFALLGALYQSVTKNIQGITDIRVLVDGKEVDTLSGHFFILRGLKEAGIAQ
jgi:hypothetical protein